MSSRQRAPCAAMRCPTAAWRRPWPAAAPDESENDDRKTLGACTTASAGPSPYGSFAREGQGMHTCALLPLPSRERAGARGAAARQPGGLTGTAAPWRALPLFPSPSPTRGEGSRIRLHRRLPVAIAVHAKALARAWRLSLGLGMSLGLAACGGSLGTPDNVLVIAWNIDSINTFDPARSSDIVSNEVISNLCDTLVIPDPADATRLVPGLAERWQQSADRRRLTFHLRPDLRFADGRVATAEDLAWSIRRNLQLNMAGANALREYGFRLEDAEQRIRAVDAHTLELELDRPYPQSVIMQAIGAHRLSSLLDRQTLLANQQDGDLGNRWLGRNSACVGPYRLREWNAGEVAVLERNPGHWRETRLERVILRHVAESATQRLLLERGDVDVARNLNAEDLGALEGSPDVRIEAVERPQIYFLDINNDHPILGNAKVRLALRYLFDYQALADSVMRYNGVPRASFVPLGSFGALDAAQGQPFRLDIDKARQLLAEAGHAEGFELKLLYGTPLYSAPIAQHLQHNAAQVGIKLSLERMTNGQLFTRIFANQFELSLHSLDSNIPDAHGMASRLVFNPDPTPRKATGAMPTVFASYYSSAANREVEAALLEPDEAKRIERYQRLQRQQMQEGPFAYLFQLNQVAALHQRLRDWRWNGSRTYYAEVGKTPRDSGGGQ
ncbi:ABC transporter substrate-binding protein [Stutzerimonas kirkiae]|nr:ABC transporter substrate-binding protein [Stutzerimonas kirkiae]